jgi:DNA-binding XRE family transcriptional regulator
MSERKSGALLTTPHGFGLGLSTVQLFFGLLYRKGMCTINTSNMENERTDRQRATDLIVGQNVARIRNEQGMTPDQLARASGVSEKDISEYEQGKKRPSSIVLVQIATALGVTVDRMFENMDRIDPKNDN